MTARVRSDRVDVTALRVDGVPALEVAERSGVSRDLLTARLLRGIPLGRACTESPVRGVRHRPVSVGATRPFPARSLAETREIRAAVERRAAVREAHARWLAVHAGPESYRVDVPGRGSVVTPDLLGALRRSRAVVGACVVRVRDGALLARTPASHAEGAAAAARTAGPDAVDVWQRGA